MTWEIQENIEKALNDKDLNLDYVWVRKGAMDEGEESTTYYTTISIVPALEPREVKNAIEKVMPAEWCKHDYDCCGGWYQGSFNVVDRFFSIPNSGSYLVTVSWDKNI
tara:strand:- start:211 stop:534 length:324 start_codon:yes stop_codon:yes gene_type:complete